MAACYECGQPIVGGPVVDPAAEWWLGDQAPVWCSEECLDASAERQAVH